jgi:hypothetical protein
VEGKGRSALDGRRWRDTTWSCTDESFINSGLDASSSDVGTLRRLIWVLLGVSLLVTSGKGGIAALTR